jgi:hypothetical protein
MAVPRDPDRKLVSPERLLVLLNRRLDSYGHCHNCRLSGPVRRLKDPEDDGRNWSRYIALVCTDGVSPGCSRLAERIISDAGREYNLREIEP